MAFVNEELTQEERDWFAKKNIINPVYEGKEALKPIRWTIDRERKSFLIQLGVHREWPDETVFFFQMEEVSYIISLKRRYEYSHTVVWSLENTCYNPFDQINDPFLVKELKVILEQALEVHKLRGVTDSRSEQVKIVCEFL